MFGAVRDVDKPFLMRRGRVSIGCGGGGGRVEAGCDVSDTGARGHLDVKTVCRGGEVRRILTRAGRRNSGCFCADERDEVEGARWWPAGRSRLTS
jgi:hypothetical protein